MTSPMRSTIAQLLFANEQALDFARIVAELETVLTRLRGEGLEVQWDCDDVVTFDTAETRILLACAEYGRDGREACLTVAVGPRHPHGSCASDEVMNHLALCSRLVERIQQRNPPLGIIWRETVDLVDADMADAMLDLLPVSNTVLPPVDSILDHVMRSDLFLSAALGMAQQAGQFRTQAAQPRKTGSDARVNRPVPPRNANSAANTVEVQTQLRKVFKPQQAPSVERPNTQMRLTAHCFNAALIMVYAPLGAAVMTYSLLKGEDLHLSARLMSVAGTLVAVSHTPLGTSFRAMADTVVALAQTPLGASVRIIAGV